MIGPLIYALCALTSAACCVLLWRGFARTKERLLYWSAGCFAFQTVNNILLVVDKVVLPTEVDLRLWRVLTAFIAACLLLYGLVREDD